MAWQVLAIAHVLFSTVFALLQRSTAQVTGISAGSKTALYFLLGLYPTGLIWAFTHAGNLNFSFPASAWVTAFAAGFTIALANYAIFIAAETVEAGQLTIIGSLRVIVIIFLSFLFLGEMLTLAQLVGAILIIVASYLATTTKGGVLLTKSRGLKFALGGMVLLAIGIVLEKATLDQMTFETYLIVGWGLQTAWITALSQKSLREDGFKNFRPFLPRLMLLGFVLGLSGLSFIKAVVLSDNVPIVAAFGNLNILVIILGAYVVLTEKDNLMRKILGGLLAVFGVGLLLLAS